MNYIGFEIYVRYYFKYSARKERKTLGIVIIAVNRIAFKIILVVKKIIYYAAGSCFKNSAILSAPRNGHRNMRNEFHTVFKLLLNSVIKGHNNPCAYKALS